MTKIQSALRALRERQSKERGRMAELATAENLTDETRSELDTIEARSLRTWNAKSGRQPPRSRPKRLSNAPLPRATWPPIKMAKTANALELRSKAVRLGRMYSVAAIEQRAADGAELELNTTPQWASREIGFLLELLATTETRAAGTPRTALQRTWTAHGRAAPLA